MGFFDQLAGMLFSNKSKLMDEVVNWITQQGNINGIIEKFKQGGLAATVESWMGNGENLPVSSDQIKHVLGLDAIKQLSQKIELDTDSTSNLLSKYLPQIIAYVSTKGLDLSDISDLKLTECLNFLKNKFS